MGFAAGFRVGWDAVSDGMRERERQAMLKGVQSAMEAKPEASEGFTAEQGEQLRAAAESGQYDVGYDEARKAYTVTPKADPSQVGVVAQQGVTDFMGQRTAGALSPEQVQRTRNLAVADAMTRFDPVRGFELRRSLAQDEMNVQRFAQEQKRFDREAQAWSSEDAYKAKRQETLAGGHFARNKGQVTPGQMMEDYANLVQLDAEHGKISTEGMLAFQQRMQQIEDEGYTKALRLAQSGAPIEQVVKTINGAGKGRMAPDDVLSDAMVPGADGVQRRIITLRDGTKIDALAELDALGKAGEVFNRFYQAEQNRRGNAQIDLARNADARAANADVRAANADARAASEAATGRADKRAQADAAVALYQENNPNATPAQLEAVRRGILQAVPKTDGSAPSEVKLAQAMVTAGLAPDMRSGLEMALTKKTRDPGELHKEFVAAGIKNMAKPEDAVAAADKVMQTMGYTKQGTRWAAPGGGKAAAKLQNVTDADIKATAQKYGISEADVRRQLGLQ